MPYICCKLSLQLSLNELPAWICVESSLIVAPHYTQVCNNFCSPKGAVMTSRQANMQSNMSLLILVTENKQT